MLRAAIDNALAKKPADLDELLKILRESGCEVSKRGKSYRLKLPGWGKVSRLDKMCIRDREYHNIVAQPTEHQKEMVQVLSERASKVHSGSVDPSEDNMLKITGDGRKLGLDQRIINQLLPDEPGTKVKMCIRDRTKPIPSSMSCCVLSRTMTLTGLSRTGMVRLRANTSLSAT